MVKNKVRALRGAITVEENSGEAILEATRELLQAMVEENNVEVEDIISIIFTMTKDLNAVFPAFAARQLGWVHVPLLCCTEVDVPESLPRCIRVLMHINSSREQHEVKHLYLNEAAQLRQDLSS